MSNTYNSIFPALNIPGISQRRKSTVQQASTLSNRFLTPPKYPSYLKQTLYGKLVYQQYRYFQHKHDANKSKNIIYEEQFENLDLRLPTFWNSDDKSKNIQVGDNGLDLSYVGPGKQDTHAALVRSNFPMRPQCGIFYFEAKIISKGDDGYIGIGFCTDTNKLERLPGWDSNSYGYHGDDGFSFAGSGTGKPYGPCFTTGDVIGCGVNFAENSAFYTKNGKFLGTAFTHVDLNKPIYPAIGLRTPGEEITTNFGHEAFVFDIEQYIHDQKIKFIDLTMPPRSYVEEQETKSEQNLHRLILSYLSHHGYTGTAKAVVKNMHYVSGQEPLLSSENYLPDVTTDDMERRQSIRSAIIQGNIDEAITFIDMYFPGVLEDEERGQELQLKLKCGKFIEMIREYSDENKSRRLRSGSIDTTRSSNCLGVDDDRLCSTSILGFSEKPRRLSYASIAAAISPSSSADMMDIDSKIENDHLYKGSMWSKRPSVSNLHNSQDGHLGPMDKHTSSTDTVNYLKFIMQYGQTIQEEYRHDTREKTRSSLVEIFSLLAYPDPESSPVSHLLNMSRRDALATEVNAAILAYQQRPEVPAMERIYGQIIVCNDELAWEGDGTATLINIEEYCKNGIDDTIRNHF